jgi:hypothetical protein
MFHDLSQAKQQQVNARLLLPDLPANLGRSRKSRRSFVKFQFDLRLQSSIFNLQ